MDNTEFHSRAGVAYAMHKIGRAVQMYVETS